ncbi:unnamed protein product [Urochloa decumbens]|uniref:F-box domain-containing protein n=1 Tax=Urochloa decumbens TaxID=240449 RepID=A0ABC9B532_9POAL
MAGGGEDRISALPDDALLHIVSFLPSDDAVRTSVLARRWLHLWKSTRSLRITGRRDLSSGGARHPPRWGRPWTASTLTNFMNHFLLLRGGGAPVDVCEILCGELYGGGHDEEAGDLNRAAGLWIRHALATCNAPRAPGELLAKVELKDATFFSSSSVDFSRCAALEDLTMDSCKIHVDEISSPSLTRLSIVECYFDGGARTRISAPRLGRLQLSLCNGMTPLLEKMPMLVAANVRLEGLCGDSCIHNVCKHHGYTYSDESDYDDDDDDRDGCYCIDEDGSGVYLENVSSCESCYGSDDGSSVLLGGLSSAVDLELTSDPLVFIFRKDCNALIRNPAVKTDNNYGSKEQLFLVPKHLNTVYIKCPKENELVKKLIMTLTTNGVCRNQIRIEENFSPPELSGYETEESDRDGIFC